MARGISAHPRFDQLFHRIMACATHVVAVQSVVFRCTEPTYATESDLLTGEGSRKFGGRWNPALSFATVYSAFSDLTALAESKANHIYYGLDPADALPRTIVSVDMKICQGA